MQMDGTHNRVIIMNEVNNTHGGSSQGAFVVDMGDIPAPSGNKVKDVEDTFAGAVNFAFIGSGQGGGRIAGAFWGKGYRRVVAVNTAEQDLAGLELPDANKLVIGGGGAGKDPDVAEATFNLHKEDVLDLMRRGFGRSVDRVMVCVGAGGGTGGGTCVGLIELAKEFMRAIGKDPRVGVIVATPKRSEGARVHANSEALLHKLRSVISGDSGVEVSPVIRVDNDRIDALYPVLSVQRFWSTANQSVVNLFHLFNMIAVQDSQYIAFDAADYKTLLNSGQIVFGAMPVPNWRDETAIAYAVRENLKHTVLAGDLDITKGKIAGAIVVAGAEVLKHVPQRNLEHAFEQLGRILRSGNTVHQGIYTGSQDAMVVYTMIGGLDWE